MPIVGGQPEGGVRVVMERPRAGGPPWRYEGQAATQSALYPLLATLDGGGEVLVELPAGAPPGLADKVKLMVRAAWKHARDEEASPPLRLARWRADR